MQEEGQITLMLFDKALRSHYFVFTQIVYNTLSICIYILKGSYATQDSNNLKLRWYLRKSPVSGMRNSLSSYWSRKCKSLASIYIGHCSCPCFPSTTLRKVLIAESQTHFKHRTQMIQCVPDSIASVDWSSQQQKVLGKQSMNQSVCLLSPNVNSPQ